MKSYLSEDNKLKTILISSLLALSYMILFFPTYLNYFWMNDELTALFAHRWGFSQRLVPLSGFIYFKVLTSLASYPKVYALIMHLANLIKSAFFGLLIYKLTWDKKLSIVAALAISIFPSVYLQRFIGYNYTCRIGAELGILFGLIFLINYIERIKIRFFVLCLFAIIIALTSHELSYFAVPSLCFLAVAYPLVYVRRSAISHKKFRYFIRGILPAIAIAAVTLTTFFIIRSFHPNVPQLPSEIIWAQVFQRYYFYIRYFLKFIYLDPKLALISVPFAAYWQYWLAASVIVILSFFLFRPFSKIIKDRGFFPVCFLTVFGLIFALVSSTVGAFVWAAHTSYSTGFVAMGIVMVLSGLFSLAGRWSKYVSGFLMFLMVTMILAWFASYAALQSLWINVYKEARDIYRSVARAQTYIPEDVRYFMVLGANLNYLPFSMESFRPHRLFSLFYGAKAYSISEGEREIKKSIESYGRTHFALGGFVHKGAMYPIEIGNINWRPFDQALGLHDLDLTSFTTKNGFDRLRPQYFFIHYPELTVFPLDRLALWARSWEKGTKRVTAVEYYDYDKQTFVRKSLKVNEATPSHTVRFYPKWHGLPSNEVEPVPIARFGPLDLVSFSLLPYDDYGPFLHWKIGWKPNRKISEEALQRLRFTLNFIDDDTRIARHCFVLKFDDMYPRIPGKAAFRHVISDIPWQDINELEKIKNLMIGIRVYDTVRKSYISPIHLQSEDDAQIYSTMFLLPVTREIMENLYWVFLKGTKFRSGNLIYSKE